MRSIYNTEGIINFFNESAQNMLIERLYSGMNEAKQRELKLLVSCLHNHSVNL